MPEGDGDKKASVACYCLNDEVPHGFVNVNSNFKKSLIASMNRIQFNRNALYP